MLSGNLIIVAVSGFAGILLILYYTILIVQKKYIKPLKNIEAIIQSWINIEPYNSNNIKTKYLHTALNLLLASFKNKISELYNLIEESDTGILVVDSQGIILFANSPASHLLNRNTEKLQGEELGLPVVTGRKTEIEIHRGHGEQSIVELSSSQIEWQGKPAYLFAIHDVTARHEAEETTRHQALHDSLTGLPNRAHFNDSLNKAIQRAKTLSQGLAVLFLDLDRFKEVNDTLGHAAGDNYLKIITKRLRSAVRSDDLVARMSGDEFTIILEGISDRDSVIKVTDKLHAAISMPLDLAAQTLTPKVTIGYSLYPHDAKDASNLLICADTAMYQAKAEGRHRTQYYDTAQSQQTSRRFWMEHGLQQAEANNEFELFYQPQMDLATGRPTDVEVLLRWQHPEKGLILPGDFIPVLEETDQIESVGTWIFRQAANDFKLWRQKGLSLNRVWVNVSSRQLASSSFVAQIDELIASHDVNPICFGIEMTESGLSGNIEHVYSIVTELQHRGFRIAMDDFGKGYSALTFLRCLPIDMVKIDRAFMRDLNVDPAALKLVRAIISMANALEMQVLAEGVETRDEACRLIAEGCQYAQGFWFAHPMPSDELIAWWQSTELKLIN